jgi:type I restriction enzyme R subunit
MNERPHIDPDFEEVTEGEELTTKEKLKTKWAQLEAMVGSPKRLALVAQDIVQHFENRLAAMDGKGMIVCMSRRICVALYEELVRLRPDWHGENDEDGALKVVMTGTPATPKTFSPTFAPKSAGKRWASASATPKIPSSWSLCGICGSPASMPPASTPCMWISPCAATT